MLEGQLTGATNRIDADYVARALRLQARCLRDALLENPVLRSMINGIDTRQGLASPEEVRDVYARLLRMSADYVQFTVPALRAASLALSATGDVDDALWADRLARYATDETDETDETDGTGTGEGDRESGDRADAVATRGRGHETWALADLSDLGATELAAAPLHPAAAEYGWYFVSRASEHPYAILGAKSLLEELSVRVSGPILASLRAARIAYRSGQDDAARFLHHHGDLDVEHGRQGARDLRDIRYVSRRQQILEGAYVTTGIYRQLAHHYLM